MASCASSTCSPSNWKKCLTINFIFITLDGYINWLDNTSLLITLRALLLSAHLGRGENSKFHIDPAKSRRVKCPPSSDKKRLKAFFLFLSPSQWLIFRLHNAKLVWKIFEAWQNFGTFSVTVFSWVEPCFQEKPLICLLLHLIIFFENCLTTRCYIITSQYLKILHCPNCGRWFTPGRAHSKNAKWYRS